MNQLQAAGAKDEKDSRWAPIFTNRFFLGLWTNRNPLRSPTGVIYENYYRLGGTDAMIAGTNVELSNRLTICRRPGNPAGLSTFISSANIPDIPDSFYSFHELAGTIRVFVDTPTSPYLIGGFTNGAGTASQGVIPIFTKNSAVPQSFFQGVGQSLYFSDSAEQQKWLDFGAGNPGNSFSAVTATSLASNVATITAINSFAVGQTVVISQTANSGGAFNGTFLITAANPSQFQFKLTHANIGVSADTGFANATWNWQPAPPTVAPVISIVASGSAASVWVASTVFPTMGLIVDSIGNVEQMVSVNASGTNSTPYGTTGNGEPVWNQTPGGTTSDGTITWTNFGPIVAWAPNKTFNDGDPGFGGTLAQPCIIFDPVSQSNYFNDNTSPTTGNTGAVRPVFSGGFGNALHDGQVRWHCIGAPKAAQTWKPLTSYPALNTVPENFTVSSIVEPVTCAVAGIGGANPQQVFWQVSSGGTSAASGAAPPWNPVLGQGAGTQTKDGDLIWLNLGSATRITNTFYAAWTGAQGNIFSVIKDTNNNFQVCVISGTSSATATGAIPWETTYGKTTVDGTGGSAVHWVCVGPSMTWASSTKWYLPTIGFFPPFGSVAFGGASILDSNSNLEFVIASGLSGTPTHPAWSTSVGGSTTDNAATWRMTGPASTNSLSWTKGYGYVYAYKARTTSDLYSPAPLGGGLAFGQPAGTAIINGSASTQTPIGSADGSVSTASPNAQMAVGPNPGSVINLSGFGSTDPQVDTISIFRTLDGGATFFWLTDISNPQPIQGVARPWAFQDFIPDVPTAAFPGTLNQLVLGPINHSNDPPPVGAINLVSYFGRIWVSVGATVFCSQGPNVGGSSQPPGNGYTAFNPGQFFTFPSPVTKMVPTNLGLLVFTTSDLGIIAGGPNISTMFPNIFIPGLGLASSNALSVRGGLIDMFTADNQVVTLDPNMGVTKTGYPIGDQFFKYGAQTTTFNPSTAYVTFHTQGLNDEALFVADGSTGWFRGMTNLPPDSAISGPVWSPKAAVVGGCRAIASLEVSPGQHALLIGATSANKPILVRDSTYTTFSDNGTAYPANFTFGSMLLANPGQQAEVGFITCEFEKVGTSPKLAVMLDEITDSVMIITAASQSGNNTTYTYTLVTGFPVVIGSGVTVTGMADSRNNGTFTVSGVGGGTFTVVNSNGVTRGSQTGAGTLFEDLSGYTFGATGLPPQDAPLRYGATLTPATVFSNRYYLAQSINGVVPPQGVTCRHMQARIDFGSSDVVQNEILTMTVFGRHWQEV
jgi:hypothetical protein